MKELTNILSGIGILIALYLVISNASAATKLVTGLLNSATSGIKVLQGRG